MASQEEDHWSAKDYQNSASFVPKLATKVLKWLDVQPDDRILDIGCGDGILNLQIAKTLAKGTGYIHGVDSSVDMIDSSIRDAGVDPAIAKICTFEVLDAITLSSKPALQKESFNKIFSNAALHWILRPPHSRDAFFRGVRAALQPSGVFVFEMGGMGNVAEMRTVLLSVVSKRVGIEKAREVDPWFFPDEAWVQKTLTEQQGWKVERCEREYRPTKADEGGIGGWVKLMGKQFFDAVEDKIERSKCEDEAIEILKTVCESPGGGDWIGYVRLRVIARKIRVNDEE